MKNSEIIIATFFIIESIIICYFFYVYSNNEKKNKIQRENELKELQNLILNKITETVKQQDIKNTDYINKQEIKLKEISKQLNDKFELLGKDIKISQEHASLKIESGFDLILKENIKIQTDYNLKIDNLKNTFDDYSKNIELAISKYSEDNHITKLEANKFKEEMQQDLKSILMEIKAPLDLE